LKPNCINDLFCKCFKCN